MLIPGDAPVFASAAHHEPLPQAVAQAHLSYDEAANKLMNIHWLFQCVDGELPPHKDATIITNSD